MGSDYIGTYHKTFKASSNDGNYKSKSLIA
jgi:hypothetical protein